jgi:hypothetical protein
MRLRPSDVPSLTVLRIASPLIAAILVLLSGVISWQNALEGAEAEAKSRAKLLESQVAGITRAQFVIHDAIAVRLAEIDPSAVQDRSFHVFLKALFETTSQTYGIGLVALTVGCWHRAESIRRYHVLRDAVTWMSYPRVLFAL